MCFFRLKNIFPRFVWSNINLKLSLRLSARFHPITKPPWNFLFLLFSFFCRTLLILILSIPSLNAYKIYFLGLDSLSIPYILKENYYNILSITCVIIRMFLKVFKKICWSTKYILYIFIKLTINILTTNN